MGSKWQMEKHNDPYYKKAKKEDYRSRASYKLKQLDKKYKLIKEGNTVVDLGAAPGGWSQVALEKVGEEGIVETTTESEGISQPQRFRKRSWN